MNNEFAACPSCCGDKEHYSSRPIEESQEKTREFKLTTTIGTADAECISLLSQIMSIYQDGNHAAIAAWFSLAYGGGR